MVDLTTSEVERAGENLRRLEGLAREWLAALGIRLRPDPHHLESGTTFIDWSAKLARGEVPSEWEGDGPLPIEAESRARKVREIRNALSYAAWVHRLGWLWGRACESEGIARSVTDSVAAAEERPGAREYQPEALRRLVTVLAESTDLLTAVAPKDVAAGLAAVDKASRDRKARQEAARAQKGRKAGRDRALIGMAERHPELSAEQLRRKLIYSEPDRRAAGLEPSEIPSTRTIQRVLGMRPARRNKARQ